ncbi:MAG: ABC transporter ATP-binding protein, partial [Spirochaetia bacterium]|nr:ABC transporter ATP-binding protein [Spirochaetia bacterium]
LGRGGPQAMLKGEMPKDFKGTMKKLLGYMGVYKYQAGIVLVLAALSTVFSIFGPKILGRATTTLVEGVVSSMRGGPGIDFDALAAILGTVLGLYLVAALLSYVQGWIMAGVSAKLTLRFRQDLQTKINRMPLRYFDATSHGEVLSRMTNDVDTVNQTLNQSLSQMIISVVGIVGAFIMMLSISWQMTAVAFITIPLSLGIIRFVVGKSQKYYSRQQEFLGHVNGHIEEIFSSHGVVKAFNGEAKNQAVFDRINDTLYSSAWKSQFLSSIMMPVMNFVGNLGYVGVTILGGYLAATRAITVGDVQAFIQYIRSFTHPMSQIANISNVLQQTAASAERVFAFLEENEEKPETALTGPQLKVEGTIDFRSVKFGYSKDVPVIHSFSAAIKAGMRVAIVGPTGAGKTTMVKLLMRFYDVDEGEILVDGKNINSYQRQGLRRLFGMVLQDTWLFSGTIMDNIRYGRQGASEEEVYAAAQAAHADHFIRAFPDGYNTVLNEETSNISQGQKQLLTIARAILADPPLLILDEATSSVDTHTEALIQKAMANLMKGRTSFIIAHRLSTIRDADLILVMDSGDIVEQGTHEALLRKNGFYSGLYNSQFETKE